MTVSPAIADPVIELIRSSVGARIMTRVQVSSPSRPVVPLMPANTAEMVIGPGVLNASTVTMAFIVPLMSVKPLHSRLPSTKMSTGSAMMGWPALSISETLTLIRSPLIVLLSGSRSIGSSMVNSEYPLLSKVSLPELEP